ncbi:MAG TPA: DUF2059 domain-containing protein [Blastocatellia bacterium]|jgi:hypothetical protein|nr:DUF2059 domain-containing protein [Blastocatellia bacterium]
MKIISVRMTVASIVLLMVFAAQARGQEAISPEKRALIAEMLEIMNVKKTSEEIMNTVLSQMEKDLPRMMSQMLSQEAKQRRLSEKEMKELEDYLNRTSARLTSKFRELFAKRINIGEVIEQISYPLYDKFFTEAELKDLVGFYKTPTGLKAIKVVPELMGESMQRSNALIMPKIMDLINEIKEEQLREMDKAIKSKN